MKNPFREFIEGMESINGLPESSEEFDKNHQPVFLAEKVVDEALVVWLAHWFPGGFKDFDLNARNLLIQVMKEAQDTGIEYPLYIYLDAIFNHIWKITPNHDALKIMRACFIIGYCYNEIVGQTSLGEDEPPTGRG